MPLCAYQVLAGGMQVPEERRRYETQVTAQSTFTQFSFTYLTMLGPTEATRNKKSSMHKQNLQEREGGCRGYTDKCLTANFEDKRGDKL